jgi:hypothetical protein
LRQACECCTMQHGDYLLLPFAIPASSLWRVSGMLPNESSMKHLERKLL